MATNAQAFNKLVNDITNLNYKVSNLLEDPDLSMKDRLALQVISTCLSGANAEAYERYFAKAQADLERQKN